MKQSIIMKLGLCLLVGTAFVDLAPRTQRAAANEPEPRAPQAGAMETKARERDFVAEEPSFGPVIERLIIHPGDSGTHCVLDLDTGEFLEAPLDVHYLLRNLLDKATKSTRPVVPITRWAQSSGGDLTLAMTSPEVSLILYEGVISPAGSFAATGPGEVLSMATEALQQRGVLAEPKPPMWMFQRPGPPHGDDAFVFQTREGGIGLMQIVGFTEKPRSVKIRYRTLDSTKAPSGISLSVDASGQVVFDKKVITFGALEELLKERLANNKDLPVIISSAPTTQHDALLAVHAVVRGSGVTNVHFTKLLATETEPAVEESSHQLKVIHLQHLKSSDLLRTLKQLELVGTNLSAAAPEAKLLVLRGDPSLIEEAITLAELLDVPPPTENKDKKPSGEAGADASALQEEADPSYEWVHERVINHPADNTSDYFLDLDSGRFVNAPHSVFELLGSRFDGFTKLGRRDETIKAWARDACADLTVGFTSPDVTLSLYGGAICFPTLSFEEAKASDVMKAANNAALERKKGGKTLPPLTMFHRHELDREGAFVFQTREGGIGLLQIVSSTEKPRSVKIRYKLLVAGTCGASSPTKDNVPPPYDSARNLPARAATVTSTFALRHVYASQMALDLKKQILQGRAGTGIRSSADTDNREITVPAPPDVMKRVQTFITVTDFPDAIERGPDDQYLQFTVMRTARSFFYACAIEDSGQAISNLLSLHVLAELKGDTRSKQFEDYQKTGVPDAEWEASLRADWRGKKELMQRLMREWNRYPLQRIVESGALANSFGVKHYCSAWFEGAPKDFYYLEIEPSRPPAGAREVPYFFSSLPPWWNPNANEASLEPAAAPAGDRSESTANDGAASTPNNNDDERRKAEDKSQDADRLHQQELESFQGTWALEIIQTMTWPKPQGNGADKSGHGSEQQGGIKGNEITWTYQSGREEKPAFTIDPAQSPKQIDVTFVSGPFRGKKCQGIYERGGESRKTLSLCLTDPLVSTARPTRFAMDNFSRHAVIGLMPVSPAPDAAAADKQAAEVEGVLLELNQPGAITVVVSLGSDDGVKSGDILTILRKGKRVGSLKIVKVERDRSTATIMEVDDVKVLEKGDQVTNRKISEGPPPAAPRPLMDSDAQRKVEVPTGTLSGRLVYDGEPPVARDLFPGFADLDIDKPQERGPDGRFSGVEAVYRDYLKHRIRPTTLDQSLRVGKDKGLADVVLWVVSEDIPWTPSPENQSPVTVHIKNASFSPRAIALTIGQPLIIENHDPVNQSVSGIFSRTANPAFNALLKAGSVESSRQLTLPAAEPFPARISLQHCPWTSGIVFVHSNPYVAISQEDGSFRISNLPIGKWEFQAWHPRSGYIMDWPDFRGPRKKGRFTQKILAGDNRLAPIKLQSELFKVRNAVDTGSLLGQWKVVAKTSGGEPVDKFNFDGMEWKLGKETLDIRPATINRDGAARKPMPRSSYSVDNTQSPAHFNWTFGEGKASVEIAGIYELKDDALRVCVPQHGEPRPTGFETDGQKWTLYEFRRDLKE